MKSLFIMTLAALTFVSCTGERKEGSAPLKGRTGAKSTFNYVNIDEPASLDPAYVKDLYEGIVSGLIYDGLVLFGKGTDVQPGLAERWEISPDQRTYTFYLRDAVFHNGKAVTSADVRYSFTRILKPETLSDRKWVLDRIEGSDEVVSATATHLHGLETPDAKTVRIRLREPYPVFLTMLAMPNACIIPENAAGTGKPDPAFDRMPIGSGPWILEKRLNDQRLEFRRNEKYWGGVPKLERFIYHVQVDDAVQRKQFEVGNFDIYQVGFSAYENWMRDPKKREMTTAVQELRTDFFGFMNNKPKFADKRVKQAITHAINRQGIFENLQKKRGVLAHGPVPPGVAGYDEQRKPRAYDPERARVLLAQANALPLAINLWYRDEALFGEIARSAKKDLELVGVTVNLFPRDQAAIRQAVWDGTPDMYIGSWTLDYPYIENAMVPTFHSRNIPGQGNGSHFSVPEVDRMLEDAEREADPQLRIDKYRVAEERIVEECPWVFLFHRKVYYAVQPGVKGFTPAIMYNADRFIEVEKR